MIGHVKVGCDVRSCEGWRDPDRIRTIKFQAGVGVIKFLLLLYHDMPPKTQDEVAALRLREAKAQLALARANVEKLKAERVAKEAELRRDGGEGGREGQADEEEDPDEAKVDWHGWWGGPGGEGHNVSPASGVRRRY